MVITLTLLSLFAGVGARLLSGLLDAYFTAKVIAPASSEGQLAMKRMVRELRLAQAIQCESAAANRLSFLSQNNGQTTFWQLSAGSSSIFMDQGGLQGKLLAQYVKEGSFNCFFKKYGTSSCLVMIAFTVYGELPGGGRVEWPLSTAVHVASGT